MSNGVDVAVAQKLVEYIDKVGMVAGNAAEYGWTLILRQAYVILFVDIVIALLVFIIPPCGYFILKMIPKALGEYKDSDATYVLQASLFLFLLTIWVIAVVYSFCHFSEMITIAFNPEYWAIDQILKKVGH